MFAKWGSPQITNVTGWLNAHLSIMCVKSLYTRLRRYIENISISRYFNNIEIDRCRDIDVFFRDVLDIF